MKRQLSIEQKRLDTDIWIIAISTIAVFAIYMLFGQQLFSIAKDYSVPILLRLFMSVTIQFGMAGLGITIVYIFRRERLSNYGLKRQGSIWSILISMICFVPYFLLMLLTNQIKGYQPLSIMITDDILAGNLFINIIGVFTIAIVWGFFEGFNYVVISDKINKRYPTHNKWLDWGAFTCAMMCIFVHFNNFSILGLLEILTTFILIYGMLLVKKYTNNAWGCIFVFLFLWNAF